MSDPFQNLAQADPNLMPMVIAALESRAADPTMRALTHAYLDRIDWDGVSTAVEIGSGTGPVARLMAEKAPGVHVLGIEPSPDLTDHAQALAGDIPNIDFRVGDGAALDLIDGSQDLVVFHAVLCHVTDPEALMAEAARVLAPHGTLVVFDADFSKASLGSGRNDPLHVMAQEFVARFVTDPYLTGKLKGLVQNFGLTVQDFRIDTRVSQGSEDMRSFISWPGRQMVDEGLIGLPLLDALEAEFDRRITESTFYGFQAYVTLMARKTT